MTSFLRTIVALPEAYQAVRRVENDDDQHHAENELPCVCELSGRIEADDFKHGSPGKRTESMRVKFEEQHFFAEAKMYGLVSEDWNNLANAIVSEYNDYTDNYVKLAERAEANGDKEIAAKYREIAADEEKHHNNFMAAVSKALKPD